MRDQLGRFIKGDNERLGYVTPENTRVKISNNLMGRYQGKDSPTWKGGRWKDERGYIRIPLTPGTDDYVYEHRLVMEKIIGRKLLPEEIVHHINGVKDDNHPDNLKLFNDKSSHVSFENRQKKGGSHALLCASASI